jgi:adenine-specific DNA-methyltransferase
MGHFAHLQALNYADNPERLKRNPNLARPLKEIFLELVAEYNHAVFDNRKENQNSNQNVLDLLPDLKDQKIDLAYFDPPYTDSHSDYQAFYHFLETFTEYWEDKKFVNGTKRYFPPKWSGFDKKSKVLSSLDRLFTSSEAIFSWWQGECQRE